MSRLTINQVVEAQRLKLSDPSLTWTELGERFGVHRSTVQRAVESNGMTKDVGLDGLSHDVTHVEVPVIVRDYSHLPALRVYPLGDVHLGAQGHQAERWVEWLRYLESEKDTSLLGTGDFFNCAIVGSKSDVYDEVMTVGKAKRLLVDQLRPLAEEKRIDVLLPGNHEMRVTRAVGDEPIADVAHFLDVPYASTAALLVYIVGDVEYDIYVRHGTGNGQSLAGLSKAAMVTHADCFITGHTHRVAATADEYFKRNGERLERRRRYYVSSGSFLSYEAYAAERGYVPTRIGAPRLHLSGVKKDIHVSI